MFSRIKTQYCASLKFQSLKVQPWIGQASTSLKSLQCFDMPDVQEWPSYQKLVTLDIFKPEKGFWETISKLSNALTQMKIGKPEEVHTIHRVRETAVNSLNTLQVGLGFVYFLLI